MVWHIPRRIPSRKDVAPQHSSKVKWLLRMSLLLGAVWLVFSLQLLFNTLDMPPVIQEEDSVWGTMPMFKLCSGSGSQVAHLDVHWVLQATHCFKNTDRVNVAVTDNGRCFTVNSSMVEPAFLSYRDINKKGVKEINLVAFKLSYVPNAASKWHGLTVLWWASSTKYGHLCEIPPFHGHLQPCSHDFRLEKLRRPSTANNLLSFGAVKDAFLSKDTAQWLSYEAAYQGSLEEANFQPPSQYSNANAPKGHLHYASFSLRVVKPTITGVERKSLVSRLGELFAKVGGAFAGFSALFYAALSWTGCAAKHTDVREPLLEPGGAE